MTEETRDRVKNPSINFPQSPDEAHRALRARFRKDIAGEGYALRGLGRPYTEEVGFGMTRSKEQVAWLETARKELLAEVLSAVGGS